MTPIEIITVTSCLLGMLTTIISLIKPIINLNTSITKLNDTVTALQGDMFSYKNDARTFSVAISDLTNRICMLEVEIKSIKDRLDWYSKWR